MIFYFYEYDNIRYNFFLFIKMLTYETNEDTKISDTFKFKLKENHSTF